MRDSIFMSPSSEVIQTKCQSGMQTSSTTVCYKVNNLAASGEISSLIHLIIMYLHSMEVSTAEFALRKASDAGSLQATFVLTLLNYYGLVEGGRYSRKAAFAYHAPSMYILGSLLQQGIALQHHPYEAESWLQMATILDPMGKCSHNLLDPGEVDDEVLIEDIIDALEAPQVIFDTKKAAASAKRLSIPMPKSGYFVKLNGKPEPWEAFKEFSPEVGFKMIRQAAENGFVTAMYHLSSMFRCGYGTEPDPNLADAWFYAARRLDEQNKGLRMVGFTIN